MEASNMKDNNMAEIINMEKCTISNLVMEVHGITSKSFVIF